MKGIDVISQLLVKLPQLTDKFTDNFDILSITRSSTILTVNTKTPHGLLEDGIAVINGAIAPISIGTLTRALTVGTLLCNTFHDLTEGVYTTITISGATESEFNGTFTILSVINRRRITFTMLNSGATTATGSPVLEDAESTSRGYNRTYKVLSVTERSFNVAHEVTGLPNPIGTIKGRGTPRISGGVSPERLFEAYTQQSLGKYWLYVVINNTTASKDRTLESDATANIPKQSFYRQQIIQAMSLYVFIPVTQEIAARQARDEIEDLFPLICQSVLNNKFNSQLASADQNPLMFSSHQGFRYDKSVYVHEIQFEQVADLSFNDTVGHDLDVAMRDISISLVPDLGTEDKPMTVDVIDLDETPE